MKKTLLTLLLLCTVLTITTAQPIHPDEGSLIYYMPKKVLLFDIEYEETVETKGIFYQYSERYLGTKDIITEDGTTYRLRDITLHTQTHADQTRAYTVPFNPKYPYCSLLTLTDKGLLAGVNMEQATSQPAAKPASGNKIKHNTDATVSLMPLLEEQLVANSTAKMAESTARQIYRIRETRLNLLAGETEHVPADGKAMKLVLKELDKQEQALTELFVGHKHTKILHQRITYIPEQNAENEVIFRFSSFQGPVDKDDMSGNPYYLTLTLHPQSIADNEDNNGKKTALSPIYYNIPGSADLTLSDAEQQWISTTVTLPQAGVAVALPLNIFDQNTRIVFNTKTGGIKSITR